MENDQVSMIIHYRVQHKLTSEQYEETAMADIIREMHDAGRKYLWDVPEDLKYLACKS
jgi:hypothetical protein